MVRINEEHQVTAALQHADTSVNARDLVGDWEGIVVEVANGVGCTNELFDGTLVYFPGVTLKELKVA